MSAPHHAKAGHAFVLPLRTMQRLPDQFHTVIFDSEGVDNHGIDGTRVCVCDGDDHEEYAAQIVRAVNAHDDLVAALKEARKMAWVTVRLGVDLEEFDPNEHLVIRKIDAALAKAGDGKP